MTAPTRGTTDMEPADRLIFVGGAPRSGTTLLQNMLDCHPQVLGAPEFLHLPDIIRLRNALLAGRPGDRGHAALVDARFRELILGFLCPLWEREGQQPFFSEKTPENVLVFEELALLFPRSRFLFIVRDPRATVASMLQVAKRARERNQRPASTTRSLRAATAHTRRCIVAGFRAAKRLGERSCTVVYERLVERPEDEARRVCGFLGIPFAAAMLAPGEQEHLGAEILTKKTDDVWYEQGSFAQNVDTSTVDKWRRQLTPRQQGAVLRAFRGLPELEELGYGADS